MKYILILVFCAPFVAFGKLSIVTTTTNLKSLATIVAGDKAEVISLCKGSNDPHFLEAKPSSMFKLSKADLLISIGLDLEVGWLPLLVRGARNPELRDGMIGHLSIGEFMNRIEIPGADLSRSMGDVHPDGNPHVLLDPFNATIALDAISKRLGQIDPLNKAFYRKNASDYAVKLRAKVVRWIELFKKAHRRVVTYHKTLSYFHRRFKINVIGNIEPKPGIPPTAGHIINLIKKIKDQKVSLVAVEHYFDMDAAKKIQNAVPMIKIAMIPVAVDATKKIRTIMDLYEQIVLTYTEKR